MSELPAKLFRDIPDELDETRNHGFLLGGMAQYDLFAIAEAYKLAGDLLVQQALSSREAWELAYPILFTYRHGIELYLKALLQPSKRSHNVRVLLEDLRLKVKAKFNQDLPKWFMNSILEFDEFDSGSTAFRYDEPIVSRRTGDGLERWVDMNDLKRRMDRLYAALKWLRLHM